MRSHKYRRLSAVTQVKVLSPEILVTRDQGLHMPEVNIDAFASGKNVSVVSGSESIAGNRTVCIGTWENLIAPKRSVQRAEDARRAYGNKVVGLTRSRGVSKVTLTEDINPLEGVSSVMQRVNFNPVHTQR